ncbi:hypothetical protein UB43_27420 [Pseudomonas sp. 21]|nr:hypothetical protein UB43_27420 [Pseudomonas sp. 21]
MLICMAVNTPLEGVSSIEELPDMNFEQPSPESQFQVRISFPLAGIFSSSFWKSYTTAMWILALELIHSSIILKSTSQHWDDQLMMPRSKFMAGFVSR